MAINFSHFKNFPLLPCSQFTWLFLYIPIERIGFNQFSSDEKPKQFVTDGFIETIVKIENFVYNHRDNRRSEKKPDEVFKIITSLSSNICYEIGWWDSITDEQKKKTFTSVLQKNINGLMESIKNEKKPLSSFNTLKRDFLNV